MQSHKIKVLSFFKISLKVFLFVSILCGTNTTSILSILKYWKRCKITNENKLKDRDTERGEGEREREEKNSDSKWIKNM